MTVVEQLEASVKELAELKASSDAQAQEIAALKAQLEEQSKQGVEALASAKVAADEAVKALTVEQAAHAEAKAELEKARAALANPAFAAAAVKGQDEATPEGAAEAVAVKSAADLLAEYRAIADPVERARWRADHMKELGL